MKKFYCFLLILTMFICNFALASTNITISKKETQMGMHMLSYPEIVIPTNKNVAQKINDTIILKSNITGYIVTLATIKPHESFSLNYSTTLLKDYFSTVITAKGKVSSTQNGIKHTGLTFNLTTGELVPFSSLFQNPTNALGQISKNIDERLTLNENEYYSSVPYTPLPTHSFFIDDYGITVYYPSKSTSPIEYNDYAWHFFHEELQNLYKKDDSSLLEQLNRNLVDNEKNLKQNIKASLKENKLPCLPYALGENMKTILDIAPLLHKPDQCPMGAYYLLDSPLFRDVWLISDQLQNEDGQSKLEGIQLRRGGLFNLQIGTTTTEMWQKWLGKPEKTLEITENLAYDYQLPIGHTDIYIFDNHELRLHANEENKLFSIQINITHK